MVRLLAVGNTDHLPDSSFYPRGRVAWKLVKRSARCRRHVMGGLGRPHVLLRCRYGWQTMTNTTLERAVDTDRMDEPAKQWVNVWRTLRRLRTECHCGKTHTRGAGIIFKSFHTCPSQEIAEEKATEWLEENGPFLVSHERSEPA